MYLGNLNKHDIFKLLLHSKIFNLYFVSLYKVLLELMLEHFWKNFLAYLTLLDNLQAVFGCSIVTEFMLTMFGFSKVFVC